MRKKTKNLIFLHSICAIILVYYSMHNNKVDRARELQKKIQIITKQQKSYTLRCEQLQSKYDFFMKHEDFAREQSARLDLNMGLTNELIYLISNK